MAGNCSLKQNKISFCLDLHHFKILDRDFPVSHVARELFVLENPRRIGRRANGAWFPMEHRPVRRVSPAEMMALHNTGESFSLAHSGRADKLSGFEEISADDRSGGRRLIGDNNLPNRPI